MVALLTQDSLTNQGSGTVTSGGTTAPAQGTSETWTVTAANAFPGVSVAAGNVFRVIDPAQMTEIMVVTAAPGGTGSGQSWTVTRGAESTTPVAHAAGFTVSEIVTAGFLNKLLQGQPTTGQDALVFATTAGGSVLACAMSPAAGTDAAGNGFALGYTGPVQNIAYNSSPAVAEGWHSIPFPTTPTPVPTGQARWKLLAENNMICLDATISWTAINTWQWNIPAPFPNFTAVGNPRIFTNLGNAGQTAVGQQPRLYINGGAAFQLITSTGNGNGTANWCIMVPHD
jgi:hypothetical protein